MITPLERAAANAILGGGEFTVDDLTHAGVIAIDASHTPNAKQNGIGAFVGGLRRRGLIEFTGQVVRSEAPHRKGGVVRVWIGTEAGRLWARNVL